MYRTGLVKGIRLVSQHFELNSHAGKGARVRRVRNPKYVVLGYHSVGEDGLPLYCRLPKQVFAEQMKYIRRNYRVISLQQMVKELRDPPASGQSVVVTFDDGYAGTYYRAFPILKEYAVPATVYLMAGSIETGEIPWYDRVFLQFQRASADFTVTLDAKKGFSLNGFASRMDAATSAVMYLRSLPDEERRTWCESLDQRVPLPEGSREPCMMSWEQIREMVASGISFGCHTMHHPVLSRLTPDGVRREVAESKGLIEKRLNVAVSDFAFPFGKPKDCGSIGAETFAQLGLNTAMTTIVGVNAPGSDCYRLRRMVQGNETSLAMFAYRLQRLFFHPEDEELGASHGRREETGN
jgi:peptidoglycan/xylan/chitin deacetylase (PgdA/CDA1 family)